MQLIEPNLYLHFPNQINRLCLIAAMVATVRRISLMAAGSSALKRSKVREKFASLSPSGDRTRDQESGSQLVRPFKLFRKQRTAAIWPFERQSLGKTFQKTRKLSNEIQVINSSDRELRWPDRCTAEGARSSKRPLRTMWALFRHLFRSLSIT